VAAAYLAALLLAVKVGPASGPLAWSDDACAGRQPIQRRRCCWRTPRARAASLCLDELAGAWTQQEAKEFDRALRAQRPVDPDLWRWGDPPRHVRVLRFHAGSRWPAKPLLPSWRSRRLASDLHGNSAGAAPCGPSTRQPPPKIGRIARSTIPPAQSR